MQMKQFRSNMLKLLSLYFCCFLSFAPYPDHAAELQALTVGCSLMTSSLKL